MLKPSPRYHDLEPLLINVAGSWPLRPNAFTRIPNLFPASDYVQTNTDLATMEGATEAARRTVNCILDATGSDAPKCEIRVLHEPKIPAPWRLHQTRRGATTGHAEVPPITRHVVIGRSGDIEMIVDTHVHIWELPPIAPAGPTAPRQS